MPIKYSKEASAKLFRYVKTIDVSFNPFDIRTKSARELARQMQSERYYDVNPNLKLNTNIHNTAAAPKVVFTLIDDNKKQYDSANMNANDIFFDLHLFLDEMDNEFEMSGKSLDD